MANVVGGELKQQHRSGRHREQREQRPHQDRREAVAVEEVMAGDGDIAHVRASRVADGAYSAARERGSAASDRACSST